MIDFNLIPLLPEIFLAISAMGLLIVGVTSGNGSTPVISWAAVSALAIALLVLLGLEWDRAYVLNNMFVFGEFAGFIKLMILLGLMAAIAMSVKYLEREAIARFEYPVLVLLAGLGMMLMVSANNLLALYVGLELQSLSLYVLAAIHRNSIKSSEAGIKYFILGALSSGMLLFGISLIYGFTGSIDFNVIRSTLAGMEQAPFGVIFGLVFVLAGLAFKISAAPFHMWTPDVYQGAPTSVTALFAMVPKIAAMALLMRLLLSPFMPMHEEWMQIVYFLSVVSMLVGGFGAIAQVNIKRLMAYSSIGHMGYALIGLVAATPKGAGAVILYMLIYLVMTAGTFIVIMAMRRQDKPVYNIADLAGLSKNNPPLAYALAIFMFSMSGIPPLAGFFGKLFIFQAAVAEGYIFLAVLGVVTSVVAAYYYLRIVKVMFFDEAADPFSGELPFSQRAILIISVLFIIGFILWPGSLVANANNAAAALFFL